MSFSYRQQSGKFGQNCISSFRFSSRTLLGFHTCPALALGRERCTHILRTVPPGSTGRVDTPNFHTFAICFPSHEPIANVSQSSIELVQFSLGHSKRHAGEEEHYNEFALHFLRYLRELLSRLFTETGEVEGLFISPVGGPRIMIRNSF